nr:uncharacterized protein LOC109171851 [Ipomoea batatas]
MEQHQDQFDANELQNIARDLEEDSENTISDGEQLDTTPADNTMKELFDSEQLFEYAGYYLNRDTFQSMRAGELESVLVDVWCLRLNQLDLNRWVDKPKRIFFSTQAFLQLDSPSNWGRDDNPEQSSNQIDFEQCLDTEINNVGKLDISDAQLALPKGMKIQQKYGDSPKVLSNAFAEYLIKKRTDQSSREDKKIALGAGKNELENS